MAQLKIDEQDFWKWAEESGVMTSIGEVKRRWGNTFKEKINQVNWQVHKMEEAEDKLHNILKSDEMGKVLSAYLKYKNQAMLEKFRRIEGQ